MGDDLRTGLSDACGAGSVNSEISDNAMALFGTQGGATVVVVNKVAVDSESVCEGCFEPSKGSVSSMITQHDSLAPHSPMNSSCERGDRRSEPFVFDYETTDVSTVDAIENSNLDVFEFKSHCSFDKKKENDDSNYFEATNRYLADLPPNYENLFFVGESCEKFSNSLNIDICDEIAETRNENVKFDCLTIDNLKCYDLDETSHRLNRQGSSSHVDDAFAGSEVNYEFNQGGYESTLKTSLSVKCELNETKLQVNIHDSDKTMSETTSNRYDKECMATTHDESVILLSDTSCLYATDILDLSLSSDNISETVGANTEQQEYNEASLDNFNINDSCKKTENKSAEHDNTVYNESISTGIENKLHSSDATLDPTNTGDVSQTDSLQSYVSENSDKELLNDDICNTSEHMSLSFETMRREGSIYLKRHESLGRSRSLSPLPRRYRKVPNPIYRRPIFVENKISAAEDSKESEIAPVHSKLIPITIVEDWSDFKTPSEEVFDENTVDVRDSKYNASDEANDSYNWENTGSTGLFATFKKLNSSLRGRTRRLTSGGSTSEDDIPAVHKNKTKSKKNRQDTEASPAKKRTVNTSFYNDEEFEFKKTISKDDSYLHNDEVFVNKALSAGYFSDRRRSSSLSSLRSCFGRGKKLGGSISGVSAKDFHAVSRRDCLIIPQSYDVLKLSEKNNSSREFIEGLLVPLKLPPKKEAVESADKDSSFSNRNLLTVRSYRKSRSNDHLDIVPRKVSLVTEPWLGAWDNTVIRLVSLTVILLK